jgi:hypothetical protein
VEEQNGHYIRGRHARSWVAASGCRCGSNRMDAQLIGYGLQIICTRVIHSPLRFSGCFSKRFRYRILSWGASRLFGAGEAPRLGYMAGGATVKLDCAEAVPMENVCHCCRLIFRTILH